MSADSHGGPTSDMDDARPVNDDPMSREAMETSVLDALRPLLRPKTSNGSDASGMDADESGTVSSLDDASESVLGELEAAIAAEHQHGSLDEPASPEGHQTMDMTPTTGTTPRDTSARFDSLAGDEVAGADGFETFMEIGEDLERRSRRSATMARLLDQHHHQLAAAEKERDEAYDKLARVYPVVQETARALREAMESRKVEPDASKMARLFQLNGRALDELEKVSITLFADFLWCKSAWEQYARTVEDARVLRAGAES